MKITVNISQLDIAVKRQLTVIAKRALTKEGESRFSDITPSSAETETLHDYYLDAVTLLNTTAQFFVTAATSPNDNGTSAVGEITLTFPTNHKSQMNSTITAAFTTFLVAYAVYAWLAIVEPALVERYKTAMREKLESLILLIFHKQPPQNEYSESLPPMLNTPDDTLTLSPGEHRNIAYTLGTDGIDDLAIYSTSTSVSVLKNDRRRLFSIVNGNTGNSDTTAVVTIVRTTSGELLASINVTAIHPAGGQSATDPVIIGLNPVSDSISIVKDGYMTLQYIGVIENVSATSQAVGVINDTANNTIRLTGLNAGNSVITLTANNGRWVYNLYVKVEAYTPSDVYRNLTVTEGDSITIPLPFGGNEQTIQVIPSGLISYSVHSDTHTLTIGGVDAGTCDLLVTNTVNGDRYIYNVTVTEAQSGTVMPQVYGYTNGDTVQMNIGETLYLNYSKGSADSISVSSNNASIATASNNTQQEMVTLNGIEAGTTSVTFSNVSLGWTFTLNVIVAEEEVQKEAPVLTYTVGSQSGTPAILSSSVTFRGGNDIYIRSMGGYGATLTAYSNDTSKATVQQVGDYYVIHQIAGTTTIVFNYGDLASWYVTMVATAPIIDSYTEGVAQGLSGTGDTWSYVYTPAVGAQDDVTATSSDTSIVTVSVNKINHHITVTAQTSTPSAATVVVRSALFNLTEVITFVVNNGSEQSTEVNRSVVVGSSFTITNPYPDGPRAYTTNGNIATVSFDSMDGEYTITGIAAGNCDVIITESLDSQRRYIIHVAVTDTPPQPEINGSTERNITVGDSDTISVNNGTITNATVYGSSNNPITAILDTSTGTVQVSGNNVGTDQVIISTAEGVTLYVLYHVTSSGGGGGIIPSSGYAYGYINGTFENDSSNCVNPVVQVSSTGGVKACIYNGSYLCKYENQQFGQGLYITSSSNRRPNNVVDEAVRLAADKYGVVLTPVYDTQITIEGSETISFSLDE